MPLKKRVPRTPLGPSEVLSAGIPSLGTAAVCQKSVPETRAIFSSVCSWERTSFTSKSLSRTPGMAMAACKFEVSWTTGNKNKNRAQLYLSRHLKKRKTNGLSDNCGSYSLLYHSQLHRGATHPSHADTNDANTHHHIHMSRMPARYSEKSRIPCPAHDGATPQPALNGPGGRDWHQTAPSLLGCTRCGVRNVLLYLHSCFRATR